jgi:WhiB family redox-sensing transcriptional regulator
MPTTEYMQHKRRMMELPPTTELAARVRDGKPFRELAGELGVEPAGLTQRFLAAGYMITGESVRDFQLREMKEHLRSKLRTWQEPWMSEGICAQVDSDLFFPEHGMNISEARTICRGCPVRERCLEYALENREKYGVWGATTERERRKLWKLRAA